jgi:hypothetical protein
VVFAHHAVPGFAPIYEEIPEIMRALGLGGRFEESSTTTLAN